MFRDTTVSVIEFHVFLFLFFTSLSTFPSASKGASCVRTVAERAKAKMCTFDKKAFQVHFGNDGEDFQKQRNTSNE
jgi:hypothetical protein